MPQTIHGKTGVVTDFNSNRTSKDTSRNERSMPTQNNLNESGLQCSAYISAINEAEAKQARLKAYIAYDTRAANTSIGWFTLSFFFKDYITTSQSGTKYDLHRTTVQQIQRIE